MRTITHRELRNNSASVLRAVASGESLLVTNNGATVARISPATEAGAGLPITRPATRHGFDDIPMQEPVEPVLDTLTELRGDR